MQWNSKFRLPEMYQVFPSRIPPQCQKTSNLVITNTPEINKWKLIQNQPTRPSPHFFETSFILVTPPPLFYFFIVASLSLHSKSDEAITKRNKWQNVCPKYKIRKYNGVDTKVITAANDFIQIRLRRLWANIDVLLCSGSTGEKNQEGRDHRSQRLSAVF
jgi:hypothetical protein